MRRSGRVCFVLAGLLVAGSAGCAGRNLAGPAPRSPAERPPPFAVAPAFKLPDSAGRERGLADLSGPKGLVLVIYRGHW